ncbi:MAG TPA: DNA-directed RNA polymerase subunit beta, partial [Nitrospiraceae bacterium]|nr:DNA-directed RNA polymerase subunit beta [Nitrospiraceae bacterium]
DAKVLRDSKIPYDIVNEQNGEVVVREGSRITPVVLKKLENLGIKEIPLTTENLGDRVVLCDIVDTSTGEVIIGTNGILTEDILNKIIKSGIEKIELLYIDNFQTLSVLRDTLAQENIDSTDAAIIEIYKRLRPGESPTIDTAKMIFDNLFFNAKRYDLAPVGRLKLNKKLEVDVPISQRTLSSQDIIETIRYLVNLKANKG